VGFFATDIPYGSDQISRFGVEETVVDGVIVLSSTEEGLERHRYVEIYKLRNTAHAKGRHSMTIGAGGVRVYPRYTNEAELAAEPPPLATGRRLPSGVPSLDALLGGGLLERSVTLVSGSAGIGKTTLALQFLLEAAPPEPGLYVTFEEGTAQLLESARSLGLPLAEARAKGSVELMYLSRDTVRPSQLVSLLEDRVRTHGSRRVVLDGMSHLASEGMSDDVLRQLVAALVRRLKVHGATTLLTFESHAMYATDAVTDRRFSPVADNLIMLRYARVPGAIQPTLTVVKTRGSTHDFGTYRLRVGKGGLRLEDRSEEAPEQAASRREGGAKRKRDGR
jgi:circadian clock protein KaiC